MSLTLHRWLAALWVALLLGGCATGWRQTEEAQDVATLLAGYRRLAGATLDEQRREFNAAQEAFEKTPTDTTRLTLALALLLPRAPWRDDRRAQSLASAVEAPVAEGSAPRHDLAQLLLRLVAERQRLERDDQRRLDQQALQLREERRKVDELQQKIEQLRGIDRETRMRRKEP